jgi:hypothetical protein
MKRLFLSIGLAALACHAGAVVLYKSIDASGRVTYSDQPPSGGAARVTPLEIDTSALPTANLWRDSIAQQAGASNIEELVRRRPAEPNEAAVRDAQARVDRARAALDNAQNNSIAEDWIYYGNGHRGPRPEYAARLESLDTELKAAEQQLAEEERKARLGY